MNALFFLAIAKVIKPADVKAASETVGVGTHVVDGVFRIRGTVTKGEDYVSAVSQSIPWQRIAYALFAVLARHIGPKAVMAALAGFEDGAEIDEVREGLNAAGKMFAGAMTEAATQVCSGKVTHKLTVCAVEAVEVTEAARAVA